MGFPVGYSELLLPRLLLNVVFLMGSLRGLITWSLDAVGLGDLLDYDAPWPEHQAGGGQDQQQRQPEFRSASAILIEEVLPVVRYEDLIGGSGGHYVAGECAVCLCGFEGGAEVRRLSNCRHVFHRCCLDRWMGHDQSICPLCRAPLFPEEMVPDDASDDRVWATGGIPDYYDAAGAAAEHSPSFPYESSSSTTDLLLPHHNLFHAEEEGIWRDLLLYRLQRNRNGRGNYFLQFCHQ